MKLSELSLSDLSMLFDFYDTRTKEWKAVDEEINSRISKIDFDFMNPEIDKMKAELKSIKDSVHPDEIPEVTDYKGATRPSVKKDILTPFGESIKLLRDLADLQNGAPLEQHRKEWEDTMNEVYGFLNKWEEVKSDPMPSVTQEEIEAEARWRFTDGHGAVDQYSVDVFKNACKWINDKKNEKRVLRFG